MRKGFASRLHKPIKKAAELILNHFGHIFPVVFYVVLHHSGQNSAQSALIIKTVIAFLSYLHKVLVRAFLLYSMQLNVDLLIDLSPFSPVKQVYKFPHHEAAIGRPFVLGDDGVLKL